HYGGILIGSRQSGLILWAEDRFEPFATEADEYLARHHLSAGSLLPSGHIALATLSGGVVVINPDGHLYDTLNPSRGLPDGRVNYLYTDRQGGLWMAFNSQGLMRADIVSPVTVFDE